MNISEALKIIPLSSTTEPEEMLETLLGLTRMELRRKYQTQLSSDQEIILKQWIERRNNGEPLAYVLGFTEFYGYKFEVGPGVLIPRSETELLVEAVINWSQNKAVKKILDLGCGSGCIGLTLEKELNVDVTLCDLSSEALQYARKNKKNLNSKATIIQSDVLKLADYLSGEFDVVVANPPYIAQDDIRVAASVKNYEPHLALFSGPTGMEFIEAWTTTAMKLLRSKGLWAYEMGAGQKAFGSVLQVLRDYQGHERIVLMEKTSG